MKYLKIATIGLVLAFLTGGAPSMGSGLSFACVEGTASWYAAFSPGIRETTANMEIFDHNKMTCAMWDIPFDTMLEVTNIENGRKVIVRVNDRGPAKRLCEEGRVIDLTLKAFLEIENPDKGLTNVRIRILR